MKIRLLLLDIDGVMSSGDITYLDNGAELKTFDVQDGMGITLARMGGLKTGIITGRTSPIVQRRAEELKMDIVSQGHLNKMVPYLQIREEMDLKDDQICYVGDDVLDLPLLTRVGFSVAVANARDDVKAHCDYVTVARGGRGAVREVVDLILKRQGKYDQLIDQIMKPDS